jgi:AbrB family looped-hinge helix DNA binding protein
MKLKSKVSKGGKLSIPAKYKKTLNIKDGSEVIFSIKDGEMTITPINLALERARKTLRKYVHEDTHLVDELIKERRKEAENE